jgi:hypothetical protein
LKGTAAHILTSSSSSHQQLQTNLITNNNNNEKSNQNRATPLAHLRRRNRYSGHAHEFMQHFTTRLPTAPPIDPDSQLGAP